MTIQINNYRTTLVHLSAAILPIDDHKTMVSGWCYFVILFGCVSQTEKNVQPDRNSNPGPSEYRIAARPAAIWPLTHPLP
jgi:hypothetical protein